MPIYEYQCSKCGVFECNQRITDKPLKHCPTCGGKVARVISRTSFVLRGSGWYATDYARNNSKETQAEKTADAKEAGATETAKTSSPASGSQAQPGDKPAAATPSAGQQ